MAIKFISVKCPECGAIFNTEDSRNQVFCSYCGAKILVQNENEHIIRHEDVAQMTYAETDRLVRLKELELIEKRIEERKKSKKKKLIVCSALIIAGIIIPIFYCLIVASGHFTFTVFSIALAGAFVAFFGVLFTIIVAASDPTDIEKNK